MSSGGKVKAVRVPGGQLVRLETDLPFSEIVRISEKHGLNWLFLVGTPELGTGAALVDLYEAACASVGVEAPAKVTARVLLDAIEDVDDDLPEFYEDGAPKADEPTTD